MTNLSRPALKVLVFSLDEQRFALRISAVQRVVRAVEITPFPQMPDIVLGVINLEGTIVPVINVRKRFGLRQRDIGINDHFIIGRTSRRMVAMIVDTVLDVVSCTEEQIASSDTILPELGYVAGVLKLPDGMVLVHDLDQFLSLDEAQALEDAIAVEKGA